MVQRKALSPKLGELSFYGTGRNSARTQDVCPWDKGGKAKIEVMEQLPPPMNVKGIHSFLGHARFYRRFIKDFLKLLDP